MSSLATVNLLNTNSVKSGSTNVKKIKLGYMELWPENKQYVQHDWVEGNQAWIDTGIKPKWEWRYELKVRITSSTVLGNYNTFLESLNTLGYLIGCYNTTVNKIMVRCEDDTVYPRVGRLEGECTNNFVAGDFIEYIIDPQNKYLKGVKKNSSGEVVNSFDMTTGVIPQASGDMNNYSIHLFARNVNGSLNNQPITNAKIYYFKIYEANTDTLVHNFVPCHDTLNNKHGMMDTVTGLFYQNANSSGSLTCGDDLILYEELECTETYDNTTNRYLIGIDTGYPTGGNISKIWTKLYIPSTTSRDFPIIQNGSYTEKKGVAINYFPSIHYTGGNYYINGVDKNSNYSWSFYGGAIAELTYERDAHTLTFNGNTKTFSAVPDAPSGNTLKIWNNQTGTQATIIYTGTKFYGYKVWSEGALVCDLRPAYKEGQFGAYDVVRNIFCPMNYVKVKGNNQL